MRKFIVLLVLSLLLTACIPMTGERKLTVVDTATKEIVSVWYCKHVQNLHDPQAKFLLCWKDNKDKIAIPLEAGQHVVIEEVRRE